MITVKLSCYETKKTELAVFSLNILCICVAHVLIAVSCNVNAPRISPLCVCYIHTGVAYACVQGEVAALHRALQVRPDY